jgi:hypothetical protein
MESIGQGIGAFETQEAVSPGQFAAQVLEGVFAGVQQREVGEIENDMVSAAKGTLEGRHRVTEGLRSALELLRAETAI